MQAVHYRATKLFESVIAKQVFTYRYVDCEKHLFGFTGLCTCVLNYCLKIYNNIRLRCMPKYSTQSLDFIPRYVFNS